MGWASVIVLPGGPEGQLDMDLWAGGAQMVRPAIHGFGGREGSVGIGSSRSGCLGLGSTPGAYRRLDGGFGLLSSWFP